MKSTDQVVKQLQKEAAADLVILLSDASALLTSDSNSEDIAKAITLLTQYHEARADGTPEVKRLRGMFGIYWDSDQVVDQLSDWIARIT
ncbi:hypothetical protein LCGC14_1326890 [marine sediment metagenome]|uniref:Uncharacterized protein n=1 Tax=marine sediment metagenome TaxID=412755 RepID=A0A0F9L3N8_9ZZZZ